VHLTQDAETEEESTPELKQEDFSKAIVLAACGLIVGTEEGWLSEAKMGIDYSKVSSNDLGKYDHQNKLDVFHESTLGCVNCNSDCGVKHASRDLCRHQDSYEQVETDCESCIGEIVAKD